jgi:hypothetical protein
MSSVKKRHLDQNTYIPIAWALSGIAAIMGGVFAFALVYAQGHQTAERVEKIEAKLEAMASVKTDIEWIKENLKSERAPAHALSVPAKLGPFTMNGP